MLLGRQSELRRVVTLLKEGGSLTLVGEAGVGKSALLRAAVAELERPAFVSGALATLSWMPYLPLERALGRSFGEGDAAYVASEVEHTVGSGLLVLDDLHWADSETRRVLPFLAGRIALATALRQGDPGTPALAAELAEVGFELVELEPLAEEDAGALVRGLRGDLSAGVVEQIVRRSGGNPLLVEELAAHGEATTSLRLALSARLRTLSPAGRRAMGLLALAGRPLPAELLGPGARELEAVGLGVSDNASMALRHALLAERAADELDEHERRSLHSYLAGHLEDPGEAARHHAAAGERGDAQRKALVAAERATTPGERAAHLAVAVDACGRDVEADRLRLTAAGALVEAGDSEGAERALAGLSSTRPLDRAEAQLLRWRARWAARDLEGGLRAWEEGMTLASGTRSEVELRLLIEGARRAWRLHDDPRRSLELAEAALALARERGTLEAEAQFMVGHAGAFASADGWEDQLRAAMADAHRRGDPDTELSAGNSLAFGLILHGHIERGLHTMRELVNRAGDLRLLAWERRFRIWVAAFEWHAGRPLACAAEAESLHEVPLTESEPEQTDWYLCQALADLGRGDDAAPLIRSMRKNASDHHEGIGDVLWVEADTAFWAGRPREALAAADEYLARFPEKTAAAFVAPTRAWAAVELERAPAVPPFPVRFPIVEGARAEVRGVERLDAGDYAAAQSAFEEAAELWRGRHFRGHLRSRWALGEAARRAGDTARAREALEAAEALASERGYVALLGRIHRSLRLAGMRRSAARGQAKGGLTKREREVLDFVAAGLTNAGIARRLGLGRPTVDRLVASASRKLGARSRAQAAAMAGQE